jgi:myo-inositol 2-dehydrogenase / D-chiro-inositol 1-dehydrogenase
MSDERKNESQTRRDFIKTSAVLVGSTLTSPVLPGAWAAGSDEIRIGLVGSGGRGRGAVKDALEGAEGVRLVAVGDAFEDRIGETLDSLKEFGERAAVPRERCFVGLDAYDKVIAADVNYVILASPPGFRPDHLRAAVAAGKNVFAEKPVAVDGPGIRAVLEVYEEARKKGLGIGVGTQRRHQDGYMETMKRVQDGAIGDITAARCYWNQGGLWTKPRQPGWTDLEWQMRNWLYFTWLSGDHIVEQHVHNIDAVNWAMGAPPVSAVGMGGRQSRTDPAYGHIYDHFSVDYEYANGVHLMSMCRQIAGCDNLIAEFLTGTKGRVEMNDGAKRWRIGGASPWGFEGKGNLPYRQEHTDLIASIRAGRPLNELKGVAESTLTAIMGRMSAYTGKKVTSEEALRSDERLVPERLAFGPMPVPPVAIPGA